MPKKDLSIRLSPNFNDHSALSIKGRVFVKRPSYIVQASFISFSNICVTINVRFLTPCLTVTEKSLEGQNVPPHVLQTCPGQLVLKIMCVCVFTGSYYSNSIQYKSTKMIRCTSIQHMLIIFQNTIIITNFYKMCLLQKMSSYTQFTSIVVPLSYYVLLLYK